jgi:outer membrane protein assembly factor BamB
MAGLTTLPVVDNGWLYLRDKYLTCEKWDEFAVSGGRIYAKTRKWDPSVTRWKAHEGIHMTAICKAGNTVFSGSRTHVYAVNAETGKELWKAPVPAPVTDLAFNNGYLFASCKNGAFLCFGSPQ